MCRGCSLRGCTGGTHCPVQGGRPSPLPHAPHHHHAVMAMFAAPPTYTAARTGRGAPLSRCHSHRGVDDLQLVGARRGHLKAARLAMDAPTLARMDSRCPSTTAWSCMAAAFAAPSSRRSAAAAGPVTAWPARATRKVSSALARTALILSARPSGYMPRPFARGPPGRAAAPGCCHSGRAPRPRPAARCPCWSWRRQLPWQRLQLCA